MTEWRGMFRIAPRLTDSHSSPMQFLRAEERAVQKQCRLPARQPFGDKRIGQ